VHAPTDYVLETRRIVPGRLVSVSSRMVATVRNLFAANERVVLEGKWAHGLFAEVKTEKKREGAACGWYAHESRWEVEVECATKYRKRGAEKIREGRVLYYAHIRSLRIRTNISQKKKKKKKNKIIYLLFL
jgi:hypothetical protein